MALKRITCSAYGAEALPEEPPAEFRIFKAGVNESTKGPILFDEKAAAEVMATYRREGVDLMIDLNHDSLDAPIRPDMGDARGWFRLELRGGELWAVDVRWTPDGERRLREKVQRYISPAFNAEEKTGRVCNVLNVALVAMPATLCAVPLVAANKLNVSLASRARVAKILKGRKMITAEQIKAALAAITEQDGDKAIALLESMLASMGDGAAPDAPAEALAETAEPPVPPEEAMAAAALIKLTGCKSAGEAAEQYKIMLARVSKLDEDSAALEMSARRDLVAELVKLGVEIPATAWEGEAKDRKVCVRLAAEPIDALRSRVAALKAARPARVEIEPPARVTADVTKLSRKELDACKKAGLTPEDYAERKANAVRRSA